MSAERSTVLIVDDDAGVTYTFARMLRLEGYDVRTALDAEGGLHEIAMATPDLVLLDLRMPCIDGVAFLRQLRSHQSGRRIPVAMITGDYFIGDALQHEIRDLNAELCFKPLWLDDLLRLTERLLRTVH